MSSKISLTPIGRLRQSFAFEFRFDRNGSFNAETYKGLIDRHNQEKLSQDKLFRTVFIFDSIIIFLISGKDFSIPGTDILISSIPAAVEILVALTSLFFLVLCITFVNVQSYSAVIDEFGNFIVNSNRIDPDYFNSSRKENNYVFKIFRTELNLWGSNIYRPSRAFKAFSIFIYSIVGLVFAFFLIFHPLVSIYSMINVYDADLIYLHGFFFFVISLINITSLLIVLGMLIEFDFYPYATKKEDHDKQLKLDL